MSNADRSIWQFPKNVANKVPGWRADGKGLENKDWADPSSKQDASANLTTLAGIASPLAAGLRDYLDVAPYVATRTALAALDPAKDTVAYLTEADREGVWIVKTASDYTAITAADTASGITKISSVDATKVWVRQFDALRLEWFVAEGTAIVYCPGGTTSAYSTGTNFATASAAMRTLMLAMLEDEEWWIGGTTTYGIKHAKFGIELRHGRRYRFTSGWNLTSLRVPGLHIYGHGAKIVADYAGGTAVVDLVHSQGITIHDLNIVSDNGSIPNVAVLIGQRAPTSSAGEWSGDIHLENVWVSGYWDAAAGVNMGSELNRQSHCYWENYSGTGPAWVIDNQNRYGIENFTQCSGVTVSGVNANPLTLVAHTFDFTQFRTLGSNDEGAVRLISTGTNTQNVAVSELVFNNCYFTCGGADTDVKAAIYVDGRVDGLKVIGHFETATADANYQLTHLIYNNMANWGGGTSQIQKGWHIDTVMSFAELSQIGQSQVAAADVEVFYEDFSIRVKRQIGTGLAGAAATMFGPNMTLSKFSGTAFLGDADLLDFSVIAGWNGDIYSDLAHSNLTLPAVGNAALPNFAGRYITPSKITAFPSGTYNPTFTSIANLDSTPTGTNFRYWREGGRVFGYGEVTVDATAAASTLTKYRFTVPIPKNFAAALEVSGGGGSISMNISPVVFADTTNDEIEVWYFSGTAASVTMRVDFNYEL